jgi:L-seryl-tRNA(Ser) seleniumtransferase
MAKALGATSMAMSTLVSLTPQIDAVARRHKMRVGDVAGRWDVELVFVYGSSQHRLFLETNGNRVTGTHFGQSLTGELSGSVDGDRIRLRSTFPYEGAQLTHELAGSVEGDRMSGEVSLGEYGRARWTARRHRYSARA